MSIGHCQSCSVTLGPWEAGSCFSCRAQPSRWYSNSNSALWVLERVPAPLSVYDVERGIRRDLGKNVNRASLNVSLASDLRFCWGGKGIYGLFRHGLIPGARSLAPAAKLLLYSWGDSLEMEDLAFVMRHIGYRFQQQSLANALSYDDEIKWETWTMPSYERSPGAQWRLVALNVAPDRSTVDEIADMYQGIVGEAVEERRRRLA